MSAEIVELKNADGTIQYPVTRASAVYMANGVDTVERILADQIDQGTTITFGNGTITKVLASGSTVVSTISSNQIVEVTTNSDGVVVQTKTITFNSDGSITITVDTDEEEEE